MSDSEHSGMARHAYSPRPERPQDLFRLSTNDFKFLPAVIVVAKFIESLPCIQLRVANNGTIPLLKEANNNG